VRHSPIRPVLRGALILAALAVLIAVAPGFGRASTPNPPTVRFSVSLQGHGKGSVSITIGDTGPVKKCPPDCLVAVAVGTHIVIRVTAEDGSYFTGFGEPCAGTPEECGVTVSSATRVTATFQLEPTISVGLQGAGKGTVTATVASATSSVLRAFTVPIAPLFVCLPTCSAQVSPGTKVVLTPTPAAGSTFAGWNGEPCAGTPEECGVTVQRSLKVSAIFRKLPALTVVVGPGAGSVTSEPKGISCPGVCTASFPPGAKITLTQTPDAATHIAGTWGGDCSGTTEGSKYTLFLPDGKPCRATMKV
jgi:hypothetical protein